MHIITEIVTMKILDGITNEDFINIVDGLENNYHSKCVSNFVGGGGFLSEKH